MVLIETLWNVNVDTPEKAKKKDNVLIETLWNVNTFFSWRLLLMTWY